MQQGVGSTALCWQTPRSLRKPPSPSARATRRRLTTTHRGDDHHLETDAQKCRVSPQGSFSTTRALSRRVRRRARAAATFRR